MITKYFTKVSAKFNPFSATAKPARLFLARIPNQLKSGCQVDCKLLSSPSDQPMIKVTFKDKHTMEIDPTDKNFEDIRALFDAHSRKLALQEALES